MTQSVKVTISPGFRAGSTGGDPEIVSPRVYPLPRPDDDPRFTFGLTLDVRRVLTEHGYPESTSGADFLELQMALFGYLYADAPAAPVSAEREPYGPVPSVTDRGDEHDFDPADDHDGLADEAAYPWPADDFAAAGDPDDEEPPTAEELAWARAHFAKWAVAGAYRADYARVWLEGPCLYRATVRKGLALAAVATPDTATATTETAGDHDGREPTAADLAAIDAEMPVIDAEIEVIDAEAAIAAGTHNPLATGRLAAAHRHLDKVTAGFTFDPDTATYRPIPPAPVPTTLAGAA
ncbi:MULTISPECIES: DUF6284 family protein [Frankiaceae]|uniref:Uncharacterized protein n=1 Tax=Candidatus Protofrankia datiscae TaxID=2716812 RepID=F8B482_9ACTN|nr:MULTISPECIES: DUF6284 family protein [Protofrankia]AEH10996.1 hypothetical protein FsymDg_3719 [Candidatus Protofrankia datiscae]